MKEKLKSFMDYHELSAAQLADQIGVQRSSFSHILNGRNKPSADFIGKLIAAYPDLNANWLFGSSDSMLINQRIKTGMRDLFSEIDTTKNFTTTPPKSGVQNEPIQTITTPTVTLSPPEPEINQVKQIIEKVIIFYSDKSFTEYKPNS